MNFALLQASVFLSQPLVQELNILIGIGGQVEWTEKELRLMQSSMEHVEAKEEAGEEEKEWASEAREIFHKVEEVIDIFLSKSARYRRRRRRRRGAFVIYPLLLLNHLGDRIRVRMKMDKIQADIRRVGSGPMRPPPLIQEEGPYNISQQTNNNSLLPSYGGGGSSSTDVSSPQIFIHAAAARTLVISVRDKIKETINENLLVHSGVIEGMERMRDEFTHILMMINDFKPVKQVEARKEAWVRDLIDASNFTQDILKSFVNTRLKQVGKGGRFFKFPLFFLKDLKLRKRMQRIDERIRGLYDRKWRYGIIGDFEEERQKPASSYSSTVPSGWVRVVRTFFRASKKILKAVLLLKFLSVPIFFFSYVIGKALLRRVIKVVASCLLVGDQLESLRRELELMQALLKDVGNMEGLDRRIEVWLKLMKEILDNDGKDLLDKYIHKAEEEEEKTWRGIFRKACSSFKKVAARPKIATKIRRFNNKLVNLSERKRTYDIGKIEAREEEVEYSGQQQQQAVTTVSSSTTPEGAFHENQNVRSNSRHQPQPAGVNKSQKQVQWIRNELKLMTALFKDVESMEQLDARLRVWVEEMKDVARDAHKFIDLYDKNIQRKEVGAFKRFCFTQFVVPWEFDRMKNRMNQILKRKRTYGVGDIKARKLGSSSAVEFHPGTITDAEEAQSQLVVSLNEREEITHTFNIVISSVRRSLLRLFGLPTADLVQLQENVESLKRDLRLMDALFDDLTGMETQDGRLKAWVKELGDVRRDAEAFINNYSGTTEQIRWNIMKRLQMAKKIPPILSKIQETTERRMKYGLEHQSLNTIIRGSHQNTAPPFFIEHRNIISFYDCAQAVLVQLLTNDTDRHIISIVGMEGIGKTTLTRFVYESNAVADRFPCRAWVDTPSNCNVEELLQDIHQQVLLGLQKQKMKPKADLKAKVLVGIQEHKGKEIEEDEPVEMLNSMLTSNPYLIVLDDVRTTDLWDRLIKHLPSTMHRSRIVLTTCDVGVATHARSVPYKLQLLSDEDSWNLFIQSLKIPIGLEEQSRKIVMKCGGLPGAIVKLRDQFSELKTVGDWLKALDNPKMDQRPWRKTLDVIKGMPLGLTQCFSHLRRFPAGYEIPLRRLIVLWIAEGIVHQRRVDENPPESVAEKHLEELINRGIVQVTKRKLNGAIKKCRLPHPLEEILSSQTNKTVSPESESHTKKSSKSRSSLSSKVLHLTHHVDEIDISSDNFHRCTKDLSTLLHGCQYVISFRSFDTREGSQTGIEIGKFLDRCISRMYFLSLRVLDLERVFRPVLPNELGELVLLKYLGLRWTYLEFLPSFISKLLNLQTLDVKHTSISTLPTAIWNMEQLRHLYLDESHRCRFKNRPSNYSLTDLQTLWSVFIDENSPVKDGLDSLINLTRLGVTSRLMSFHQEAMLSQLEAVVDWVENCKQLQSLRLRSYDREGRPWYLPLKSLSGHTDLSTIYFQGSLEDKFLASGLPWGLTDLTLSASAQIEDPMRTLSYLSNLTILRLFSNSFLGIEMVCSRGGFPQLRVLKLWKLDQLVDWKVEEGAMQNLMDLEIRSCAKLKMLPRGLQHLRTLQKLRLSEMPEQFTDRIKVNQGADWHKIAHVRYVYVNDNLLADGDIAFDHPSGSNS